MGIGKHQVIVTTSWDDGHPSDLRLADLLTQHRLPATFYIPIRNREGRPTVNRSGLQSLRRAGFEIGAHTLSHATLDHLDRHVLKDEVFGSKATLEGMLGEPIGMFCYPKGRFDRRTIACVREAGYRGARTTRILTTSATFPDYEMPATIQAFPTRAMGYIRNLARRRAFESLYWYCAKLYKEPNWVALGKRLFDDVLQRGGVWHLYGHSWELDSANLWDDLNNLLGYVAGRQHAHYTCNSGVLDALHSN